MTHMTLMALILAVAATLVIALRLLVRRSALPGAGRGLLILGITGGIVGVLLAISAFNRLVERFERRNWPTVEGTVASSAVTGERAFAPQITYVFTVNGHRYTGNSDRNVPMFGNKRRDMEVALKELEAFPQGRPVRVFYDPGNPNRSTIMPEPRWNDYAQSGLGVFLFAAGLFLSLLPRRGAESRKA